MSPNDQQILLNARKAAQSIGDILKEKLSAEQRSQLARALLDELSHCLSETSDKLASEIQLGMLEGLMPESVAYSVDAIMRAPIRTGNQSPPEAQEP
jgi:hypothetical protein